MLSHFPPIYHGFNIIKQIAKVIIQTTRSHASCCHHCRYCSVDFVLFYDVTCYINFLLSHIHVNTIDLLNIMCTLVATGMISSVPSTHPFFQAFIYGMNNRFCCRGSKIQPMRWPPQVLLTSCVSLDTRTTNIDRSTRPSWHCVRCCETCRSTMNCSMTPCVQYLTQHRACNMISTQCEVGRWWLGEPNKRAS